MDWGLVSQAIIDQPASYLEWVIAGPLGYKNPDSRSVHQAIWGSPGYVVTLACLANAGVKMSGVNCYATDQGTRHLKCMTPMVAGFATHEFPAVKTVGEYAILKADSGVIEAYWPPAIMAQLSSAAADGSSMRKFLSGMPLRCAAPSVDQAKQIGGNLWDGYCTAVATK